MSDIYNDDSYIINNPTLHSEDSEFKFNNVLKFLNLIEIKEKKIKILDVGGGAGLIGMMVMEYYAKKDIIVTLHSLDLSLKMLKTQKQNNPKIKKLINCSIEECEELNYDLVLMIDVIEHIPNKSISAKTLNRLSKNIIYNIPIEINLFDYARNISLLFRYYKNQKKTLGHVHFFSFKSATEFLKKHHNISESYFNPYCFYFRDSDFRDYVNLRKNILRKIEINISCWIYSKMGQFSKYLIQGSNYSLVKTKNQKDFHN